MALTSGVSAAEIRAAQIITGATLALWLGIGFVPALKQHAIHLRVWILALYLAACAAFVIYVLF